MSVFMMCLENTVKSFVDMKFLVFIKIDILVGTVFTTNILEVGIKK